MYSCRLLNRYYVQDFDDLILINDHLFEDVPQETLLQPDGPWIKNEKDTKLQYSYAFRQHKISQILIHCHIHYHL